MNPRVRTGLLIAIVGLCVIGLGMYLALRMLNFGGAGSIAAAPPTPEAETKVLIAFAAVDVTAGKVLAAEDVTLAEIPIQYAPRDTITSVETAVGRISKTDLFQGEMILEHNLANPTGVAYDIAYILDERHVLMAMPASDLMSREAIIQRGDIVDILVSHQETITPVGGAEPAPEPEQITFAAFQRLDITAIVVDIVQSEDTAATDAAQAAAGPRRDQVVVQAYLLALDPQEALVLKYLKDVGAIFEFVLRAPTSTGQFQLTPVTAEFIKELYGLELLP